MFDAARLPTTCALLALAIAGGADRAMSHEIFHVFTGVIEAGHWGAELNSAFQSRPEVSEEPALRAASELGIHVDVTDRWMTKLALDFERPSGSGYELAAIASENVVRLDKWSPRLLDVAWFTALSVAVADDATNAVEFGPVLTLTQGPYALVVNPFFEKTFGQNREEGTAFVYAVRGTYALAEQLSIGIEAYGEIENIADPPRGSEQVHRIGPVLYLGEVHGLSHAHDHAAHAHGDHAHTDHQPQAAWYAEVGVLFGLTEATPDATLKLNAGFHY
jgi:hypothetical protein